LYAASAGTYQNKQKQNRSSVTNTITSEFTLNLHVKKVTYVKQDSKDLQEYYF